MIALDGEGWDDDAGKHHYGLLLAYDCKRTARYPHGKSRYIEDWQDGLGTQRILDFLLDLKCGHSTIICGFHLGYDIAKWLGDLSDGDKTVLWKAGWCTWDAGNGRLYRLRYIPRKLFFVGAFRGDYHDCHDIFHWPGPATLVYDVSGFSPGRSFVSVMREWQIPIDLAAIEAGKAKRGYFKPSDSQETLAYCEQECWGLADYVQALDVTFQEEGVYLTSWHGGGALASFYMRRAKVAEHVKDPQESAIRGAILGAYFGGRNEICRMGRLRGVYDYDIASAYPAATLAIPNLVAGRWERADRYQPGARYALWDVRWDTRGSGHRVGPLPFRYQKGVYFPDVGHTWIHACELATARRYYGEDGFSVAGGYVYHPAAPSLGHRGGAGDPPFGFVRALAERRVAYKHSDVRRASPYKIGLNSIYGKLAQHAVDADKEPPFQCYYAAGLITAVTRTMLLRFTYADGLGDDDIIMYATDGVFCTKERTWHVRERDELGAFGLAGMLDDAYFIQPGCWYDRSGELRSRGFGSKSLSYERVQEAWRSAGLHAHVTFKESRFIGLGQCAGTGDFSRYGDWLTEDRQLNFYPARKYPAPGYSGREDCVPLVPYSMIDRESEPYVPASFRDERGAIAQLGELLDLLRDEDQPDGSE